MELLAAFIAFLSAPQHAFVVLGGGLNEIAIINRHLKPVNPSWKKRFVTTSKLRTRDTESFEVSPEGL